MTGTVSDRNPGGGANVGGANVGGANVGGDPGGGANVGGANVDGDAGGVPGGGDSRSSTSLSNRAPVISGARWQGQVLDHAAAPRDDEDAATRDDEDAAVVVMVLAALAGAAAAAGSEQAEPRSFWGVPAFRIGGAAPGPHTWWASGLAR